MAGDKQIKITDVHRLFDAMKDHAWRHTNEHEKARSGGWSWSGLVNAGAQSVRSKTLQRRLHVSRAGLQPPYAAT